MPEQPRTWVRSLSVTNFRTFDRLKIDFHEQLTVLVAPNGAGKTAVLDALARSLQPVVAGPFLALRRGRHDVRRVRAPDGTTEALAPATLTARVVIAGVEVEGVRRRSLRADRWSIPPSSGVVSAGDRMWEALKRYTAGEASAPPDLPALAYYGARRSADRTPSLPFADGDVPETSRLRGYLGAFGEGTDYRSFERWFEQMAREAQSEQATGRPSPHRPSDKLAVVRGAIDALLAPTGWYGLDFDFAEMALVAQHDEHGWLPVEDLSDGVRSALGMAGDLAHRCARLNPHLGADAARQTSGVVLIDEIDAHLHPSWQQLVLGGLRDAFPLLQFIVSTHSPHVLSTVRAESIRVLHVEHGVGVALLPSQQTRGVESADVLAAVMGVDPVPELPEVEWLRTYRRMIQEGQLDVEEAHTLRGKLEAHFGAHHPLMLDCDRLIRFYRAKSAVSRS